MMIKRFTTSFCFNWCKGTNFLSLLFVKIAFLWYKFYYFAT